MGRPKNFSREGVLERALPVFWKHGFADTSLQDLEKATGVNKSGLYAEFADKGDLYLESLRHYLRKRQKEDLLTAHPPGWENIERFLKLGPCSLEGQKGCFSINSMNQFTVLPRAAQEVVSKSYAGLRDLIANDQSWKVSPAEGRRGDLRDAPSMREALPPPSAQDGGDSLAAQRDQHPQDQRLARALLARNHPGLP